MPGNEHGAALRAGGALLNDAMARDGIVVLPPMDVHDTMSLVAASGADVTCAMLDPWYNKGLGGVRDDYDAFVDRILEEAAAIAPHVYLWGFPEIVARYVDRLPEGLRLLAWLTWYYKNNPSVIRGWRSAQMTCLHLMREDGVLYPQHFLNEKQLDLQRRGKLRYMPGPSSVLEDDPVEGGDEGHPDVIENALLVGFVGKKEQTGHRAQKPAAVYRKLLMMVLEEGDLVVDPMCGSGTTGAVARDLRCRAILADHDDEHVQRVELRLGIRRIELPGDLFAENATRGA